MMLTIHGLPISVKYQDLKALIKQRCNISDYILDNLVSEGDGTKKVRIGLADESEGSCLIKNLNGIRMMGNILSVVPVGKAPPSSDPQNYNQQSGYHPRNDYPNQSGPTYNNLPMDPIGRPEPRSDLWNQNQSNSWGQRPSQQGPGPNQGPNQSRPNHMGQQSMQQNNNYNNYEQQGPQGMNASYGKQQTLVSRGGQQSYDQRDSYPARMPTQNQGYYPKNDLPDAVGGGRRPGDAPARPHVLRSVEIVDEPLARPAASLAPARYPPAPYDHHKPMTIMKDNFQGPQYNADRPNPPYQGSAHGGPATGPGHPMQSSQSNPWTQNIVERAANAKPGPTFERKYPDPKGPLTVPLQIPARNVGGYDKPGPRFSPRRDVDALGRRLPSPGRQGILLTPGRHLPSPGRRLPSPGRRLPSPGRRLPSPGRRMPSPDRRMPSPNRRMPSPNRRMPSPNRRMPSPNRRMPSPNRRMPSPNRRMPSPGRRMPSPGRRMPSPGRRMPSPGRRMPSPGRRMPSPGRRMPSPGRRMPSPGKRMSPGRRISPGRRLSPGRRRDSPPRRPLSPLKRHSNDRYSPARHADKPGDKFEDRLKDVRPAYDSAQASNQGLYSGGYRPSLHQNVQYPILGLRPPEQRAGPWPEKASLSMKKEDARMPKFEPRIDPGTKRSHSPRKSRSPIRRDRSPPRDRYKKHSPSPRSPRRSWALEKRRSPDAHEAPPPPMWPAQSNRDDFRRFPDRVAEEKSKHVPIWEPRRPEDERRFDDVRSRGDTHREPSPRGRFPPREPRFEPREEPRRDEGPKRFEREFREHRPDEEPRHASDRRSREDFVREEFRRDDDRKIPKIPDTITKEFEDVYNRALEFKKRAEELRRGRRDSRDKDLERHEEVRRSRERSRDLHDFSLRDAPSPRDKPEWKPNKTVQSVMSPTLKAKREKATSELTTKIIDKYGGNLTQDAKERITEEMKISIGKQLQEMFGFNDISFIEMVVKFNAKFNAKEEAKLFKDVLACLPKHLRTLKRPNESTKSEVPAKKQALNTGNKVPDWQPNVLSAGMQVILPPPTVQIPNPGLMTYDMMQQNMMLSQTLMAPPPGYPSYEQPAPMATSMIQTPMMQTPMASQQQMQAKYQMQQAQSASNSSNFQERNYSPAPKDEVFNLYLCKDDFEPYTDTQAEYLKRFLVSQLMNAASAMSRGCWTPDFTVKGLQSNFRYEVVARDEETKDWLLNLDFAAFDLFNVLVYTKGELWYERAAVWLPGHSRYRAIEPLDKLKLQNKKLEGVNVGKWKFVKKIVTAKGTRVYVDMPPSSARALEKHKMLLSYELQKVSVFLKAVAVDKEAFDAGLREPSLKDSGEIAAAVQNSPMPSIGNDPNIIKLCLKGNKAFNIVQARKVKEMIIYRIFKYQQDFGEKASKTDFLKFGFCQPGYFSILPENDESKNWLLQLEIGRLNRHEVTILGGDRTSIKYIKMTVRPHILRDYNAALVLERLKQSNQGVKGLNFSLWKNFKVRSSRSSKRGSYEVEMDLESVETIMRMNYKLDFVEDTLRVDTIAKFSYEETQERLVDVVKKLKAEMTDSYDVANMDIASSSEEDDDDIVYMGKFSK